MLIQTLIFKLTVQTFVEGILNSKAIQNGLSLYEVSQILGHIDISTTQIYAHLENKDIGKKARDIMESLAL